MSGDAARYAAAWNDRRRRYVAFRASWVLLPILVVLAVLSFQGQRLSRLQVLLRIGLALIPYVAVGIWVDRFRCPRCGKLYYWSIERKKYVQKLRTWRDCRHCGLQQDALPG
jgi:predicted RNA-binding Zn-ribbon protein involved in translation (DUF1610 family)